MSSIIKVKNGKGEHWKAIYDLPKFADGTRHRTSKTFPVGTPLKTVKEFLAQKELETARGLSLENNPKRNETRGVRKSAFIMQIP